MDYSEKEVESAMVVGRWLGSKVIMIKRWTSGEIFKLTLPPHSFPVRMINCESDSFLLY